MAVVTRAAVQSPDTNSLNKASQVGGELYAGENLNIASPCRIDPTDGKVYMTDAAAVSAAERVVHGYPPRDTQLNEAVTLYGPGARFRYADGTLTPGQILYIDQTTPGELNDATGGASVYDFTVGFAVDANDIVFTHIFPGSVAANPP